MHHFFCGGMYKSQTLCMQCLSWDNSEAVFNKLFILGEYSSFQYLITTIHGIVKERMSKMFHVGANLMGTTRFQLTFNQLNISQILKNLVVCNGMSSHISFWKGGCHSSIF